VLPQSVAKQPAATKKKGESEVANAVSQALVINEISNEDANANSQPATVSKVKPVKYGVIINVNHKFMEL
jgi:hypothetical protein